MQTFFGQGDLDKTFTKNNVCDAGRTRGAKAPPAFCSGGLEFPFWISIKSSKGQFKSPLLKI